MIKFARFTAAIVVAALIVFGLLTVVSPILAAPPDSPPAPGTVSVAFARTFLDTKILTSTGAVAITTTNSPLTVQGVNYALVGNWYQADAYIFSDEGDANSILTVTYESSADGLNWAVPDATAYSATFTADGTKMFQFPVSGLYMRYSLAYTGNMTVTLKVVLKDSAGP